MEWPGGHREFWHFGANKNGLLWSGFQIGKWGDVGEKRLEVMESHFNLATEFEFGPKDK